MKVLVRLLIITALAQTLWAVDSPAQAKSKHRRKAAAHAAAPAPAAAPSNSAEVKALRDQVTAQQQQLQQLQGDLQKRDTMLEDIQSKLTSLESTASQAQTQAQSAAQTAQQSNEAVTGLQSTVTDLKTTTTSFAGEIQDQQKKVGVLADLQKKVSIGGTFFGDYAFYTHTGFGPQFIAQINQTGPRNSGFNTFDITRAYVNIFYNPTKAVTLRFTPNLYRQVDVSGAQADGAGSGFASTSNGNLGMRIKYAYVDFNTLFSGSEHFSKTKLTVGQTQQPLTDWEEGLNGYRYVYLTPWNYLTLSSTYAGAKLHGPVEWNGKEYLDYDFGVFNTASFHAIEFSDKKQGMARVTVYPMGTKQDRTGLGFTAFEDYGYATQTPDAARSEVVNRFEALAFYQDPKKNYELGFEYNLGHNAMSAGNFFSGAGPVDAFTFLGTAPTNVYTNVNALAGKVFNAAHSRQEGYATFGYYRFGHSPFRVFGTYSYWKSNTNFGFKNPFDFQHSVAGVSYTLNKYVEIALQDSLLHYTHDFSDADIAALNSRLGFSGASAITHSSLGAARGDTNGIMINMVFNY